MLSRGFGLGDGLRVGDVDSGHIGVGHGYDKYHAVVLQFSIFARYLTASSAGDARGYNFKIAVLFFIFYLLCTTIAKWRRSKM